jgi:Tfp pilus assembly protein PilO
MKKQLPLTPVLAIGMVIVAAVVWFALIGPKGAMGAALDEEKADLESKIALAAHPVKGDETTPQPVQIDVADLFRLAKAMPDREDMPGVLLEIDSVSTAAGVRFLSIQPGDPITYTGYYAVPVTLTFEGNYYDLTDFLFRLRNLVSVREGVLEANGRFYTLDALDLAEGGDGFPTITATLTVSAYSFGTPADAAAAAAPPPAQTTTGATTTGATTTGETTTTSTESTEGEQQAGGTGP